MKLIKKERWKTIEDFPDYQVSNFGRIKSFKRNKKGNVLNERLVRGYNHISLCKKGKIFHKKIHHLVLNAFKEIRPEKKECNHKDGVRTNNHVLNLEWVTGSENMKHAFKIGLQSLKGEKNNNSKLKNGEVWLIKKLLHHNFKPKFIAKMFKVSSWCVYKIKQGKTWSYIKYEEV